MLNFRKIEVDLILFINTVRQAARMGLFYSHIFQAVRHY